MSKFVDREQERKFLNEEYEKEGSSFVVIYGRRRTGKTSLIREFGKNKDMIYCLATEESETQNMQVFKDVISKNLKNSVLEDANITRWETLFEAIANSDLTTKKVIVIDEFQYLGKINSAFPSIFQKIWDEILQNKNVMVIVCGSLINMMESQVLNYNSPLYGRRTGQIKLKQIPFRNYKEFFNKSVPESDLIQKYSITGGVPKYVESFLSDENIYELIRNNIINKQSYLYDEPEFLLKNEVSEVGQYFSIIKSIAMGNRKLGNIASDLSVSPTNLSQYLQTLINLDIIEREVPITEKNFEKSKKGQYKIKDNYISFWFQFIYPNRVFLEIDRNNIVLTKIKNNFIDNHVSFVYEDVCREKMWDMDADGKFGVIYDKIGRWWNHNSEIDIVGINSEANDIIFGECKYYKKKLMDVDVFYNLKEKSKSVEWNLENRNEKYILFSITGYSERLKKLAEERDDLILA